MENKLIKTGFTVQDQLLQGVKMAVDAIKVSLGPAGRSVLITADFGAPEITRDGATIAKSIQFSDKILDQGAQLIRKAASLTEDQVGDSTSSVSVLTYEMCSKGIRHIKSGVNANELKSGMIKAQRWMTEYIKKNSVQVNGDLDKVKQVATISANNDPGVGGLIKECLEKVGMNGVITADVSHGLDTVVDVTTGMKLDRGWSSPQFVTVPEEGTCVMENAYVAVIGEKLTSVPQIIGLMENIINHGNGRPILMVCDDIDDVVTTALIVNNLRGAIKCCVVKGVDFGDGRKNSMMDIAVAVGGDYISAENGIEVTSAGLENLGTVKKVIVGRDSTVLFEGGGDPNEVSERVEILKKRLESPDTTKYDVHKFKRRIANLSGGIGIIKAGGATEVEKMNRKATIEDAILASKSAIEEGYAPGGGYVYFHGSQEAKKDKIFWSSLEGDEREGAEIVFDSLPVILKSVAENSGVSGDVVVSELSKTKKPGWGYNAKTRKFCNLVEQGILDSSKALRVALENSVSTASMILLTDCIIYDEPVVKTEEKKAGLF